jgi:hypothetical protein
MPRLAVIRPVECLPHVIHRDGEPPRGLPESVRTWTGRTYVRAGNDSTTELSIEIAANGDVGAVEKLLVNDHAFSEARRIVRDLSFDPALMNGEAVPRVLIQSFRFKRAASLAVGVADSRFLAARGFWGRAGAFRADLRVRRCHREVRRATPTRPAWG